MSKLVPLTSLILQTANSVHLLSAELDKHTFPLVIVVAQTFSPLFQRIE